MRAIAQLEQTTTIGTHPVSTLAPLEYRYALDAAVTALAGASATAVICNIPQLLNEVLQRFPDNSQTCASDAAIWIEPLADTWSADLARLAGIVSAGQPLVVVASRPLARILPERRSWEGRPLGEGLAGIGRLRRALLQAGFVLDASYGVHTPLAIWLGLLSRQMERWGRPSLGDRLQFAARLRYCSTGPLARLSTIALLLARKDRSQK